MDEIGNILKVWRESGPDRKQANPEFARKRIREMANIFSAGAFYYYILDIFHQKIDYVHPGVETVLGITPGNFSLETYFANIHPGDIRSMRLKDEAALQVLSKEIPPEDIPYYKISYLHRVKTIHGTYKTLLHQAVPLTLTAERRIGHMWVVHTDVSYLPVHFDQKISIISLKGGRSWYRVDPETADFSSDNNSEVLSERERQILLMISEGKKSVEIARQLNLSVETVSTHRKNILSKTTCKNTTELIARCIRSGLI